MAQLFISVAIAHLVYQIAMLKIWLFLFPFLYNVLHSITPKKEDRIYIGSDGGGVLLKYSGGIYLVT